jgi:hypothetical protein
MNLWIPVRDPMRLVDAARSESAPAGSLVPRALSTLRAATGSP